MSLTVPSATSHLPMLRAIASMGTGGDPALVALAAEMCRTVRARRAAGLAAPQVGISVRLIVIARGRDTVALLNPRITARSGDQRSVEGCLSLPGVSVTVRRAQRVTVVAERPGGGAVTLMLSGREAACAQHEIDHLNGVLIIDALPAVLREAAERRFGRTGVIVAA